MIFGEYVERDPTTPRPLYRHHGAQDWSAEGDVMVANLRRTMRLAGDPEGLVLWRIAGLARVDAWEAFFRSPEGRLYQAETPVPHAVRFRRNALYDELFEAATPLGDGLHLVEHLALDGLAPDAVRDRLEARAEAAPEARLALALARIGKLAPDPGGLVVWRFESYAAAEPFLRRPPAPDHPPVLAAGLYRTLGAEID